MHYYFYCRKICQIVLLTSFLLLLYNLAFSNPETSVAIFNEKQTQQDDPDLINFIKNDVLIPPSNLKLNFSNPIWKSPVASIVRRALRNKTGGFFIECGAFNGEWLSNTIEFEYYFKWSGLLIEADPNNQVQLLTKRRKAWIASVCLSQKPFPLQLTMQRHKKWPAVSNIPGLGKTKPGDSTFQFQVQCFPLYSILLALDRRMIDYLSLDAESAEWSILQTIPFDKFYIKVISIEVSDDFENSNQFLQSLGYRFYDWVTDPLVNIYVHKTVL